ncbi:hypothetical protein I551_5509 [Mycobacterium ulcerans str. Harvey]|uniref:Uncharacterized protein n=1 Tax=Mycobacterium ulcerans str. Harvey TaxID=1299332 RepID=A0ABN0QTE2_MYCUL|nr:hypothetical protein I551_5509 [Mycobacterium ulcerans str. Harvey]
MLDISISSGSQRSVSIAAWPPPRPDGIWVITCPVITAAPG